MRKIKSIKQLQAEKKRIKQQQTLVEDKISLKWKELKERLRPLNITRDAIESILRKTASYDMNSEVIIKNSLYYGIALLATKLVESASEQLSNIFNRQVVSKD